MTSRREDKLVDDTQQTVQRLVLAVDISGYSSRNVHEQTVVQQQLSQILDDAARAAGLDRSEWLEQPRGDGELAVMPAHIEAKNFLGRFTTELAACLSRLNDRADATSRLRLRIAFHQGTLNASPHGPSESAAVEVIRLLDARQVREFLTQRQDHDLALVVSDELYRSVVRPGASALDPAAFEPMRTVVEIKTYRAKVRGTEHPTQYFTPKSLTGDASGQTSGPGDDELDFDELLGSSSLGTPAARAIQALTSEEAVGEVQRRLHEEQGAQASELVNTDDSATETELEPDPAPILNTVWISTGMTDVGGAPPSAARAVQEHPRSAAARSTERPSGLSLRELEVAVLVAEGRTNQQIAEKLALSVRTVETYLSHIYLKLGVTSRIGVVHAVVGVSGKDPASASQLFKTIAPKQAAIILSGLQSTDASRVLSSLRTRPAANILAEMQFEVAAGVLASMSSVQAGRILCDLPPRQAGPVLNHLEPLRAAPIISSMPRRAAAMMVATIPAAQAAAVVATMPAERAAALLNFAPPTIVATILSATNRAFSANVLLHMDAELRLRVNPLMTNW
jgi:DNA-binding CsgD family transcriptional regulator/flagellar motility protein MotE (MotC chaperone)